MRGVVAQIRTPTWDGGATGGCDVRCQAADSEPSHGETWQPISKDDKNGGKSTKEILDLVAATFALNTRSCSTCEYVLFRNHITQAEL